MAQKSCRYAIFRLLFLVLVVAALAQSTCIDDIHNAQNSGRRLMGGYEPVAQDDPVVQGIMADTVKEYNQRSNDLHQFEVSKNDVIESYKQLVNGENYCVQVPLESVGCKNSVNEEFCSERKTATCVVKAYKAFGEAAATINRDTLQCTASG